MSPYSGSTATIVRIVLSATATASTWDSPWVEPMGWGKYNPRPDLVTNAYGWWNTFRPEEPPTTPRTCRDRTAIPTRPQARACSMDRKRWKRRRFLHSLRRAE